MNLLREAAIQYALKGWAIFPIMPGSKRPSHLVPQGFQEASSWAPDCLYWWDRQPNANIGIACGLSGLIALDVDERAGGWDTMHDFVRLHGPIPKSTPTQGTPTGGAHYLFKHPGVFLRGQLGPGVDIKDHGYILAAPSIHPNGGQYEWEHEGEPKHLPETYVEVLRAASQTRTASTYDPSNDPLLKIPAAHYCEVLTGRDVIGGWMQCPFHSDGQERTPSFKVSGTMWACFACEPLMGKQVMGGNLLDLAGMLSGHAMPLWGTDLAIVKDEMEGVFCGATVQTGTA